MLKGIEILSQSEVGCGADINWIPIMITTIIVAIVLFVLITRFTNPTDIDHWFAVCATVFVFSWIVGLCITWITSSIAPPETYKTHYKVTISDEVSMNEFLEQYEIVDQEGKIYTIKEKEN